MNETVYTRFGKGEIIAHFKDGTICVRLESGGGAVLHPSEVFKSTVKKEQPVLTRRTQFDRICA